MRYATALVIAMWLATPTLADGFCPDLEITDIYTNLDTWLLDAPEVEVIDFVGFAAGTVIDDEFTDLGIEFTNGFYTVIDTTGLNNDTWVDDFGLDGNQTTITMEFDEPLNVFGIIYPGFQRYEFYLADALVGWTEDQSCIGSAGCFSGFLIEQSFDEVRVVEDGGEVAIDNLYFSFLEVPAPAAALPLLALAGLTGRARRRRVS